MNPKTPIQRFGPDGKVIIETRVTSESMYDSQIDDYSDYLKSISRDIGSMSKVDLNIFYNMMEDPKRFNKYKVLELLEILTQLISAERVEMSVEEKRSLLSDIENYRNEIG